MCRRAVAFLLTALLGAVTVFVPLAVPGCGGGAPASNDDNGSAGVTLAGTVVDAEHVDQPLVGATVSWTSTATAAGVRQTTTTDSEGAFTLTDVEPGSGRLVVVPPDSEFESLSVDMDLSEEGADLRVPLVSRATAGRIAALSVTPATANVPFGGQEQFDIQVQTTDDEPVLLHPLWLVNSGVGSVDMMGLFTAGDHEGRGAVLATAAGLTAAAIVTVGTNVVEPSELTLTLNASASPVTPGSTVEITATVTGASGTPIYRWSTAHPPLEGSGTTVTWTAPEREGLYSVSCYVYDSTGALVSSTLVLTVGHLGQIAFHSERDIPGGIYIMREDGSDLTRLSPPEADETCPVWSPDGRQLAFLTNRGGEHALYISEADGSNAHDVSGGHVAYFDAGRWYAWSPDSTRLVFTGDVAEDSALYIVNADGSGLTRLVDLPGDDDQPIWQPGAERIAFTHQDSPDADSDIFAVNVDGSDVVNLTNTPDWSERIPVWSPDGSQIAFARCGNDLIDQIFIVNADGSNLRNLSNNAHSEGPESWSPDGTKILFWSDRESNDGRLYLMNPDGTGVTRVCDLAGGWASWSPDGRRFAFAVGRYQPQPGIWVVGVDGSGLTRLTDWAEFETWIAWRP